MDNRWMHKNMAKNVYPLKRKGKLSIDLFPYFYLPFRRYWCKRREEIKTLKDFSAVKEKKAGVTRTVFYALQHWSGLPKISLHKMHTHVYISFSRESDYSISPMITLSAFSYKNAPRIKHREKLEHFSLINSPHRWNFPSAAIQRGVLEPAVLKAQYSNLFFRLHADINWFQIVLFISRNTRCLSWTKLSKWPTQYKR